MFLQANTGDSGTGLARVHRVDPQNGVSLGSFNIGPTSYGMSANGSRGELYTLDINGNLRTWDYTSGALKGFRYVGNTQVRDSVLAANGNEIISLHGTNEIRTTNVLTGATTSGTIAGTTLQRLAVTSEGTVFALDGAAGQMRRLAKTGSTYTLHSSEAASAVHNTGNVGQMHVGTGTNGYDFIFSGNASGPGSYQYVNSDTKLFSGFGGFSLMYNQFSTMAGFLPSHVGTYGFGADLSVPTNVRITETDPGFYPIRTVTIAGINGGVRNAAIVLAPEPSSALALVAGVLLLRRRKADS